jgi:hypothetical protein
LFFSPKGLDLKVCDPKQRQKRFWSFFHRQDYMYANTTVLAQILYIADGYYVAFKLILRRNRTFGHRYSVKTVVMKSLLSRQVRKYCYKHKNREGVFMKFLITVISLFFITNAMADTEIELNSGDNITLHGTKISCDTPSKGNCIVDSFGKAVCGAGKCVVDSFGKGVCSKVKNGDCVVDSFGKATCGSGCVVDSFGKGACSNIQGGSCIVDAFGKAVCEE